MNSKVLLAAVIALVGLFYVAAPHTLHVSSGLGFGLDHTPHMALGAVLLLVAGALYFMGGKKKRQAAPAAKKGRK